MRKTSNVKAHFDSTNTTLAELRELVSDTAEYDDTSQVSIDVSKASPHDPREHDTMSITITRAAHP